MRRRASTRYRQPCQKSPVHGRSVRGICEQLGPCCQDPGRGAGRHSSGKLTCSAIRWAPFKLGLVIIQRSSRCPKTHWTEGRRGPQNRGDEESFLFRFRRFLGLPDDKEGWGGMVSHSQSLLGYLSEHKPDLGRREYLKVGKFPTFWFRSLAPYSPFQASSHPRVEWTPALHQRGFACAHAAHSLASLPPSEIGASNKPDRVAWRWG